MIQVTPVILCGGSGTRLWPLSRAGFPKQFLCLTGDESLFQQAAKRLVSLGSNDIEVATQAEHGEDYNSHNTTRLDVDGMTRLLLKLEGMQRVARGEWDPVEEG